MPIAVQDLPAWDVASNALHARLAAIIGDDEEPVVVIAALNDLLVTQLERGQQLGRDVLLALLHGTMEPLLDMLLAVERGEHLRFRPAGGGRG